MKMLKLTRIREEEQGDGGDGGESFAGLAARMSQAAGVSPGEQKKPDPLPPDDSAAELEKLRAEKAAAAKAAESSAGGKPDDGQSLFEAAKLLTGHSDTKHDKSSVKPKQVDPLLADIYESLGDPPDAKAGTAAQMDYVKRARELTAERLKEARTELETLKKGSMQSESEKAEAKRLKAEVDATKQEVERLREQGKVLQKELSTYDVRHDPEFQEQFMKPIQAAERSVLDTIQTAADADDQEQIRKEAMRVLLLTDEVDFRRQATQLASELPNVLDQTQFRNELIALRGLYHKQRDALANMDKLKPDLAKTRAERNDYHANEFLTTGVQRAQMQLAEHDPIVLVMKQGPVEAILSKHAPAIDAMDKRIGDIVKADIRERGKPSEETQQLYALAFQRTKERVLLSAFMEDYQSLQEQHKALREQYRRATGAPWAESGPSRKAAAGDDEPGTFAELARRHMANA